MARTSQEDLKRMIESTDIKVGDTYSHFKDPDKLYKIEFVGLWENTEEVCVGYRALYGKKILWVRTLKDFLAEKEVDERKTKRFIKV